MEVEDAMNPRFKGLVDGLHSKFESLMSMAPVTVDTAPNEDAAANGSLMRLAAVPIRWHDVFTSFPEVVVIFTWEGPSASSKIVSRTT